MTGEPRGFSRVTAGFSSYDADFRLPLVEKLFHDTGMREILSQILRKNWGVIII